MPTQRFHPNHLRATGVGWRAGLGRLGAICGPLLGGSLIDRRHRLTVGFYVFALVGVLGAAAAWIVPRQHTPQQHRVWKAFVRQGTAKATAGGTVGVDPPLAWRSGAPDSYGSATLVGQVDGNGQVIGNSFAAVGSVDLDIRAPAPYPISSADGARARQFGHSTYRRAPLPWGSGNCFITLTSCPTRQTKQNYALYSRRTSG